MSFAERLAKQLEQAPQKEVHNSLKKQYDWSKEASQKRPIR